MGYEFGMRRRLCRARLIVMSEVTFSQRTPYSLDVSFGFKRQEGNVVMGKRFDDV